MMWQVSDEGRIEMRIKIDILMPEAGKSALTSSIREHFDRHIANLVSDLIMTEGVDLVTDEVRYSFSTTRPEATVIWRARVPADEAPAVRAYLVRFSEGNEIVQGEVVDGDVPDQ